MNTITRTLLLFVAIITMNSCSSDSDNLEVETKSLKTVNYIYTETEIETMNLINSHRVSIGLNALEKIGYVSHKSEEHDNYMIANNVVNHNNFVYRSEDIIKILGAKMVAENIAYNYNTPEAAVKAWLLSFGHKENIEGDFTHFGIAIRKNPVTGRNYYTNIFVKM